ncbi:hypothetical protein DEU56DRAFT_756352 [Suillus clintonianus]|uniref:uncharacterized protein n=1 Tax=Suillus clintonianus TaxID=1904413 RepID=UPI001B86A96A|nr:uncharacterized protein DEU56DRAFT_756352 [Suillus clintonianus]KAG2136447.1 hypothetical protein DEU56DRAFT_756352 [Suillus clintonianus]
MDTRTITACLVSNSPANGFVDVIIREPFDQQNLLIRSKKFFHIDANIKECRITLSHTEEQNDQFQLMILYDHELHRKHNCPYLAYKFIDKSNVDDLGREDYMVVMKAIDIITSVSTVLFLLAQLSFWVEEVHLRGMRTMDTNVDSKEYEEHKVLFSSEEDMKSHEQRMQDEKQNIAVKVTLDGFPDGRDDTWTTFGTGEVIKQKPQTEPDYGRVVMVLKKSEDNGRKQLESLDNFGQQWLGDVFNLWTKIEVSSSHFVMGVNFRFPEASKWRTQLEILAIAVSLILNHT